MDTNEENQFGIFRTSGIISQSMESNGVISNCLNNYGRGCKIMVGLHGNVLWKRLLNNHLMSKNISMILIRHDAHIIQFAPRIEKLDGFTRFLDF
jgi:hypothetical protein